MTPRRDRRAVQIRRDESDAQTAGPTTSRSRRCPRGGPSGAWRKEAPKKRGINPDDHDRRQVNAGVAYSPGGGNP